MKRPNRKTRQNNPPASVNPPDVKGDSRTQSPTQTRVQPSPSGGGVGAARRAPLSDCSVECSATHINKGHPADDKCHGKMGDLECSMEFKHPGFHMAEAASDSGDDLYWDDNGAPELERIVGKHAEWCAETEKPNTLEGWTRIILPDRSTPTAVSEIRKQGRAEDAIAALYAQVETQAETITAMLAELAAANGLAEMWALREAAMVEANIRNEAAALGAKQDADGRMAEAARMLLPLANMCPSAKDYEEPWCNEEAHSAECPAVVASDCIAILRGQ